MPYTYTLHPLAHQDMINTYVWYENKSNGLGEEFGKIPYRLVSHQPKQME